jgi:hypothetical protein
MVLEGSGIAEGTVEGMSFVCTGDSTGTFTRVGAASVARSLEKSQQTAEPALIFLDNALHLFMIITR